MVTEEKQAYALPSRPNGAGGEAIAYVFKDFRLDPATRELTCTGARINVQPKVFKLLLHLVAHRHRSVTNEELLTELWAGERVSPASITTAVRQARRALGDAGNSQDATRTMRG
jgi:DNA-binding winged helix-turn-helix (wHTH) protein